VLDRPAAAPLAKDFSSSPLTVVPLAVTWDFTGPIPLAIQVRIRMVTEPQEVLGQGVVDDRWHGGSRCSSPSC